MVVRYKMLLIPSVLVMFVLNNVCLANSEKSVHINTIKTCEASFTTLKGLPDEVLADTEIYDISSFKTSATNLGKNYSGEMGGAAFDIEIINRKAQQVIIRTFKVPGDLNKTREYSPLCQHNEFFSAGKLLGKRVEGGILVLEKRSNVSGIPADLWIYYGSKDD